MRAGRANEQIPHGLIKALVSIRDTAITTPDGRTLVRTGKLWIENGDRVALLGANGSGKTRLVDRLRAALAGTDPEIRGAASLRVGYSDQALAQLDAFPTPWEAVKHSGDLADQQAGRAVVDQFALQHVLPLDVEMIGRFASR